MSKYEKLAELERILMDVVNDDLDYVMGDAYMYNDLEPLKNVINNMESIIIKFKEELEA